MCKENCCKTQPIFNFKNEIKALYCARHKKDGMVDVKNKSCIHESCKTRPNYNIEGEKIALFCATHKKDGMVDVKNKTCVECKKQPVFNIEGEKPALYCATHKKEGMLDVISKTCLQCKKRPVFNVKKEVFGLYCLEHKKEGMVDVKNKSCIYEGCTTRPNYNIEGQKKALYCVLHKKEQMIDIKNKKCNFNNCKKQPKFNIKGKKNALFCVSHKKEGMIDVKSKMCKSEWCSTQVTYKYDGYCLHCYIHLFPDKQVSHNYKTKEYAVVEYIKTNIPNNWVADKIIQGGCSKRRPDLLLDIEHQVIIIEVDENQHIDYDCSCENKRLMELSQDIGHRPIVFIRFNPDSYKKNEKNIKSCWSINGNGICVISKSKKDEWNERLNVLVEQTNYWIHNKTNKTIEIVQLFYDM
jgi:hypothetical protein